MKNLLKPLVALLMIGWLAACQSSEDELAVREFTILNGENLSSERMSYPGDTVEVIELGSATGKKDKGFDLILSSSLQSPEIDGSILQASSLAAYNGGFVISYNYRGEPYMGSIDYINSSLKLQSQVVFHQMDAHAIAASDGNKKEIYIAGASMAADGAMLGSLSISGNEFFEEDYADTALGSYAATSIAWYDEYLLVTTGDDETDGGGLYLIDGDLNPQVYLPLHDARWVEVVGDEILVAQGTPGMISILHFDESEMALSIVREIAFAGADISESKTTISIDGDMLFVAAGTSGVHLFDLKSGAHLQTLSFEATDAVTNAVAAEDELLFISNGEAGVYVASYDEEAGGMELIGKLDLPTHASVNHIAQKAGKLYVAAGLEGVHLIEIGKKK